MNETLILAGTVVVAVVVLVGWALLFDLRLPWERVQYCQSHGGPLGSVQCYRQEGHRRYHIGRDGYEKVWTWD